MCPDYSAIFWKVPRLQTRCRSRSQVRLRISQAVPKRARPSFPYSFLSGRGPFRSQCHLPSSSCWDANMNIQREVPPEYRCDGLKFRVNIFAQLATVAQAPQVCEYRAHIQQRQQFIMHSGTGGGKLYLILPRSYHIARCCHPQFACNLLCSLNMYSMK